MIDYTRSIMNERIDSVEKNLNERIMMLKKLG